MKTKIIFALFAAVILTGCHFCKPVEESMECFPLCVEKKEDIHILTEERWESFKNFRLIPYVSVGIPLLDNSGRIVEKLSRQITDEVVIPYVDVDKEGLIAIYYEFMEDVEHVCKIKKCSVDEACKMVWKDWECRPRGKEICPKLKKAIPLIQNMRADGQIIKAVLRITPDVALLLRDLPRQIKQLKKEAKNAAGIIKISAAGAQITASATRLSFALSYLIALKSDQKAQIKEMEQFLERIENFGKEKLK